MFVFPRDKELAKKWIDQIDGLTVERVKMSSKVCDAHFEKNQIVKQKTRVNLCPKAVPTLNVKGQKKNQENNNPNSKKPNAGKNPKIRENNTSKNYSKIQKNSILNVATNSKSRGNTRGTSNSSKRENFNSNGATDGMTPESTNQNTKSQKAADSNAAFNLNGMEGTNSSGAQNSKKRVMMSPQVLRKNNITPAAAQHLQAAVVKLDKTLKTATASVQKSCTSNSVIEFIDLTGDQVDDKCKIVRVLEPKSDPGWKLVPPAPQLKISRLQKGIRLIWNMNLNNSYSEIAWYELYACKVGTPADVIAKWKKIGEVQAFTLPMSCDLLGQAFTEGKNCLFAIRAIDVHTRGGPYSNTCVL